MDLWLGTKEPVGERSLEFSGIWAATTSYPFHTEINTPINNLLRTNATETEDEFSGYPRELLHFGATCFIAFAFIGVFGNSISILALSKCNKLRNATTAFIVNLCFADLLFCSITMPLSAVQFLKGKHYLSEALCKLFPVVIYSNALVSIFSVVSITVNRYILVVHPRFYPSVYKKRNIAIMIACSWFIPLFLMMFPLLEIWGKLGHDPNVLICTIVKLNDKSPKAFLHMTIFVFPFVTFIFCFTRIFFVVRKASKKSVRRSDNLTDETPIRDKKELRVLRVMFVIFILFLLCYFPLSFIKIFRKETDVKVLNVLGFLGVYFTNIINPVIYIVMSKEYRRAYKELFCRSDVTVQTYISS